MSFGEGDAVTGYQWIFLYVAFLAKVYVMISGVLAFRDKNRTNKIIQDNYLYSNMASNLLLGVFFIGLFFPFSDAYLMRGFSRFLLFLLALIIIVNEGIYIAIIAENNKRKSQTSI